jgi:hypothetical protein
VRQPFSTAQLAMAARANAAAGLGRAPRTLSNIKACTHNCNLKSLISISVQLYAVIKINAASPNQVIYIIKINAYSLFDFQ